MLGNKKLDDCGLAEQQTNVISRMQVNDTKAGMDNIDKEKINAIILKHSKSLDPLFLFVSIDL
jgi:hypothetical protein